ncbi:MAG: Gfo/Idh/MocA family oxidoreductase [Gemmatimonadota bacterium]|nr:MAG: Gfo/Idh/MocA family oxidoreductase [Gemmatimonadota bacterium]
MGRLTRREYLKTSLFGAAGLAFTPKAAPTIVPSTVFGPNAPSNTINVGQIGTGRIARAHDLPLTMQNAGVRVTAVCDVDKLRAAEGKELVEQYYARANTSAPDVRLYYDYRELVSQPDIDAVIISTPDHQHFLPALEAALAGKDIYMQKPFSLTVQEGRILSDLLHRMGTVFQVGSQQRSIDPWPHFKRACELARNGRVGTLHTVQVGLPGDPPGGDPTPMPVPENLDYDMWLGTTPEVPYTLDRVHPQERIPPASGYSRPGWLRCEQFSAGMITGWGAHHVDTAHWGMGTEFTGPVELEATAEFASGGLWDVHGDFNVEAKYANGVTMLISGAFPNGVRFEGSDGWIFVTRSGPPVTGSDPSSGQQASPIQASDPAILESEIGPDELHLYESPEQHQNWIECIRSRRTTVAPVEVAHRSTSMCLISHIAMKLDRPLRWDAINERFHDDDEANAMLSRPQRFPYSLEAVKALRVED